MLEYFEVISLLFFSVFIIFLAYRLYQLVVSGEELNEYITRHYSEQGLEVTSISRLGIPERIRYGVPPVLVLWFYSFYFGFWTGKISYVRKVEIEKSKDSLLLSYVELQISKKEVISFKEFDSYEL